MSESISGLASARKLSAARLTCGCVESIRVSPLALTVIVVGLATNGCDDTATPSATMTRAAPIERRINRDRDAVVAADLGAGANRRYEMGTNFL